MRVGVSIVAAAFALALPSSAVAAAEDNFAAGTHAGLRPELPPYLQCVPYARERSGVQIYGDAHTWWDQAAGRYARGNRPKVGAVMAFRANSSMVLGHVAAVAKVVDSRTVLLDHANWSPINGRRGQIERGVTAIDVSPANDWTQVRVWYAPIAGIGTTTWPVAGFIYNERSGEQPFGGARVLANASYPRSIPPAIAPLTIAPRQSARPTLAFAKAFAELNDPVPAKAAPPSRALTPRIASAVPAKRAATPPSRDPFDAVLARYNP